MNTLSLRTLALPAMIAAMPLGTTLWGFTPGNLLANASFEADDASSNPFYLRLPTIQGWTQFGDKVDIIHDLYTQPALPVLVDPSDGSQFLDMNQGGAIGGIFQDVVVTSGLEYKLTFDASMWATNSGGSLQYSLIDGNNPLNIIATDTYTVVPGGWVERELTGVATSNLLRVQIETLSATQAAPGVDNAALTQVPEPSSFALGLALVSMAVASRRRL